MSDLGGVGDDAIDGGPGTDILNGDGDGDGDTDTDTDTDMTGPPNDLSVDSVDGVAGTDTCQGPCPTTTS